MGREMSYRRYAVYCKPYQREREREIKIAVLQMKLRTCWRTHINDSPLAMTQGNSRHMMECAKEGVIHQLTIDGRIRANTDIYLSYTVDDAGRAEE